MSWLRFAAIGEFDVVYVEEFLLYHKMLYAHINKALATDYGLVVAAISRCSLRWRNKFHAWQFLQFLHKTFGRQHTVNRQNVILSESQWSIHQVLQLQNHYKRTSEHGDCDDILHHDEHPAECHLCLVDKRAAHYLHRLNPRCHYSRDDSRHNARNYKNGEKHSYGHRTEQERHIHLRTEQFSKAM